MKKKSSKAKKRKKIMEFQSCGKKIRQVKKHFNGLKVTQKPVKRIFGGRKRPLNWNENFLELQKRFLNSEENSPDLNEVPTGRKKFWGTQ